MASEEKEPVGLEFLGDRMLAEIVEGGQAKGSGELLTDETKLAFKELARRTSKEES